MSRNPPCAAHKASAELAMVLVSVVVMARFVGWDFAVLAVRIDIARAASDVRAVLFIHAKNFTDVKLVLATTATMEQSSFQLVDRG